MTDTTEIQRWLSSKKITLWSDFDLTRPDELDRAAQWFVDELVAFRMWRMREVLEGSDPLAEQSRPSNIPEHLRKRAEEAKAKAEAAHAEPVVVDEIDTPEG